MKAYVVAASAALILFALAGVVVLVGVNSEDGSFDRADAGGHQAVAPDGRGNGGRETPSVETIDAEPDLERQVESLLRGEEPGIEPGGVDDAASPPLATGDCELVVSIADPAGEPTAGIAVSLLAGLSRGRQVTADDGTCSFSRIAPGSYTLRLQGQHIPELEAARTVLLEPGERREMRLTLGRFDLAIAGRVLDGDGEPVPGITVEARKYLVRPEETDLVLTRRIRHTVITAEDGGFEILGLDAAEYLLSTRRTEVYGSARKVVRSGDLSVDLLVAATEQLEIVGRVVTSGGAPLEGARVVALRSSGASALSDPNGEYHLVLDVSASDNLCILKASRPGYRDTRMNLSLRDIDPLDPRVVEIRMEPLGETAVIVGRIVDEAGAPVEGETVHLYSSELKSRYQAISGLDGTFRIDSVQLAADYKVWLFPRSSFKDYSLRPVEVDREGLELEIRLERVSTGIVRGTMVDPLGRPVPGFVFWLRSTKAQGRSVSVTSDEYGRFEVAEVATGKLVFETRSLPRFTVKGLELEPDSMLDATLVLDWGEARVAGTVLDPDGQPLPGAKVNLLWTHNRESQQSVSFRHTVTDAAGRFSFSELSAGEHRIHVVSGEYRSVQITHDVGRAATEPVIRMTRGKE